MTVQSAFDGLHFAQEPNVETAIPGPESKKHLDRLREPAGRRGNVLRLIPPLVLTQEQAATGMDVICEAIEQQAN